jgi:hypothetical protein
MGVRNGFPEGQGDFGETMSSNPVMDAVLDFLMNGLTHSSG